MNDQEKRVSLIRVTSTIRVNELESIRQSTKGDVNHVITLKQIEWK